MAAPVGWRRVGSAQSGLADEHDLELVFSAHGGVDRIPRLASCACAVIQRPNYLPFPPPCRDRSFHLLCERLTPAACL